VTASSPMTAGIVVFPGYTGLDVLHMMVCTPATPADAAHLRELLKAAGAPRSTAG
jgi:hypothetical protein